MDSQELRLLERQASTNNHRLDITGLLISVGDFFFQSLEGPADKVDTLLEKIEKDKRHLDLHILRIKVDQESRVFPRWSMKVLSTQDSHHTILESMGYMLELMTISYTLISRYTQPSVVDTIILNQNPLALVTKRVERIIFFADLIGYTQIASTHEPQEVVNALNLFLEIATKAIQSEGGIVNKYIGDCVLAYFDVDQADAATCACEKILNEMEFIRSNLNYPPPTQLLRCGIGMAAGEVLEGNVGSSTKLDYTVIGEPVNLASRLEGLTRTMDIPLAVDENLAKYARKHRYICLGEKKIKSYPRPFKIFTLEKFQPTDTFLS